MERLPPKPDRRFFCIRRCDPCSRVGLAQALDSARSEESHQPRCCFQTAQANGIIAKLKRAQIKGRKVKVKGA